MTTGDADDPALDPGGAPGRSRVLVYGAVVALIGVLIGLLAWQLSSRDSGKAIPGEIAKGDRPETPDFTLPRLDREGTLQLSSLRGKAVVVNFWASWCVPCRDEAPLLQAAWERYRDRGLVIVGVDSEDLSSDARAFMQRYGLTFPNVRDGEGSVKGRFGLVGYPETFFVDPEGRLVSHIPGPVEADTLEQGIEAALAG